MKNLTKIGGVTAVAAALALTGCGGGGATTSAESAKAQDASGDINKLISVNAKKADELKQGGTVTLPVGNIGPDFNGFSNAGNSADNTELHYPIDEAGYVGCWKFDFDGSTKLNTNFCEDFQSEVKDGKQTITIKINPKADVQRWHPHQRRDLREHLDDAQRQEQGHRHRVLRCLRVHRLREGRKQ